MSIRYREEFRVRDRVVGVSESLLIHSRESETAGILSLLYNDHRRTI